MAAQPYEVYRAAAEYAFVVALRNCVSKGTKSWRS